VRKFGRDYMQRIGKSGLTPEGNDFANDPRAKQFFSGFAQLLRDDPKVGILSGEPRGARQQPFQWLESRSPPDETDAR